MKNQILTFGKTLSREQQKTIQGGLHEFCSTRNDCPSGQACCPSLGLCFRVDYPKCELI